jgi:RHS repeat-associated protein
LFFEYTVPIDKLNWDYHSFGGAMPGRTFTPTYRYNYQGQENAVNSKWQAFELRLHNSDLGRWMSPDPYGQFYSPYISMGNNPINGIDPDGGYWLGGQPGNSGGGQSYYQTPMEMHTNADAWYQSELENLYLLRHNGYIMAGYEFDCALANLNSTLDAMHAAIAMIGWSGSDGGPNYWTANGNSNSGANDAFGTPFSDVDAPRSKMEAIGSAKLQEAMDRIYYDTYDVTYYANKEDYLAGKNGTYLGNESSKEDALGLGEAVIKLKNELNSLGSQTDLFAGPGVQKLGGILDLPNLLTHYTAGQGRNYFISESSFKELISELNVNNKIKFDSKTISKAPGNSGLFQIGVSAYGTSFENAVGYATLYFNKNGIVGYSDWWNFNKSNKRSVWGEIKTRIGSAIPGVPFWVLYGQYPPLNEINQQ